MHSQCFYSVVMSNSKLGYCYSSGILSLSVIKFSFYTGFLDFFAFSNFLISRDLLKQRHIKNQKIFFCSTFRGHHDSIIKRLIKKHARKENLEQHGQLSRYYRRYVDDTLTIMPDRFSAGQFLDTLNSAYPSVKFTMEIKREGSLGDPSLFRN